MSCVVVVVVAIASQLLPEAAVVLVVGMSVAAPDRFGRFDRFDRFDSVFVVAGGVVVCVAGVGVGVAMAADLSGGSSVVAGGAVGFAAAVAVAVAVVAHGDNCVVASEVGFFAGHPSSHALQALSSLSLTLASKNCSPWLSSFAYRLWGRS